MSRRGGGDEEQEEIFNRMLLTPSMFCETKRTELPVKEGRAVGGQGRGSLACRVLLACW
jgi:hypothetical protein